MKILFLGDVVGLSGCRKITNYLLDQTQKKDIDFVILNGENADDTGVGLTEEISKNFFDIAITKPVKKNVNGISKETKPKLWNNRSDKKLPFEPIKFLIGVFSGKIKLGSSGE